VCVSDDRASKDIEENGEIDRSLLTSFLLLRTVVPVVCNLDERILRTMQGLLSKVANTQAEREGGLTVRPLETRIPKPTIMIREM